MLGLTLAFCWCPDATFKGDCLRLKSPINKALTWHQTPNFMNPVECILSYKSFQGTWPNGCVTNLLEHPNGAG
jgi:hypothetical protein